MAYEYTRMVTDEEELAINHYCPAGSAAELDRLIETGIAHTLASYKLITAKQAEAAAIELHAKYEKLEKADKDAVDALIAKVSAEVAPNEEPMEG